MKAAKVKDARNRSPAANGGSSSLKTASPNIAVRSWSDFWFRQADPRGMHVIRVLTGVLFLVWLLPFAGQIDALFSLQGWFDQQAYSEAARLPEGARPPIGWSALYLCAANPILLKAAYWASLAVLIVFTLGIATRLTAVLTWIIVVSFSANPASSYDADALLVILAFYLMIGYVLLGQRSGDLSLRSRLLGRKETWLFFAGSSSTAKRARPQSVAANVAMRLLQVHLAIVILTSGLHKLQYGDWWAGVAFWYPLYPPFVATIDQASEHMANRVPFLVILSFAAYATLCWQITFPFFAWRPRWRALLLVGAVVGWLGNAFLYQLPLFGPAIFIGCLSYLSPTEWQRVYDLLARIPHPTPARQG